MTVRGLRPSFLLPALACAVLPGCAMLGISHANDGGHKGRVVDAATGAGLPRAKLAGALPTYRARQIRVRSDGSFCYHFTEGNPGGITISCRGYEPLEVPVSRFLKTTVFELRPDTRPKSKLWDGEKEDILTPFERDLLRKRGGQ